MQLGAIDQYPGTKLGPVIGHDLELSRDGQQLARGRVTNFYFELFHISFLRIILNCQHITTHLL